MNVDIEVIKRKILIKYPPFAPIIANTTFEETPYTKTAGTNGKIIRYNPKFINKLTEDEQLFIFSHEIGHIAFEHIPKSKGKDLDVWNIATDAVLNANLVADGLPFIEGGVNIPDAINYDAEEMYEKLLKEKQNNEQNSNNNSSSKNEETTENQNKSSEANNSQNNDEQDESNSQSQTTKPSDHSVWKQALEELEQEESKDNSSHEQNKENIFDKIFKKNKSNRNKEKSTEEEKEKKIKELSNLGEKKTFKQNKIDRKKQLEELRKALVEKSHGRGTESNNDVIEIPDIGKASPLIDWKRLLRQSIKFDVDWSYKNATIEDGIVTPHLEEFQKSATEIILDTSGSVNETLLRNFLRECKNILQSSKLKVGCFDVTFYGFNEIRSENDIDNMKFYGGGGTNFNAAVNAFSRNVENKIIFTDGRAPMPDKTINAIWIVFGGTKISPKGGKVIYIDDEQLDKLYFLEENTKFKGRNR